MPTRAVLLMTVVMVMSASIALPALAQEPPNPTDPRIVDGTAQKVLDRAKVRWRAAKIRSYRYEARHTCFCPTSGWHPIVVRNGLPSKATHSDVKQIATVPRLFLVIQRAIDKKAHKLTVTYGSRGVPSKISIDQVQNVIDEEQYFGVRRFTRR